MPGTSRSGRRPQNPHPPPGMAALRGKSMAYVSDMARATGLAESTIRGYVQDAPIKIPHPQPRPETHKAASLFWDLKRRDVIDWIIEKVARHERLYGK